jgi:acetyltransferase-like isoleucine patch superfamily enzyme
MYPDFRENNASIAAPAARSFRAWAKAREHPAARAIHAAASVLRSAQLPTIGAIHGPLYLAVRVLRAGIAETLRVLWYTPLFQTRLVRPAPGLRVWGGIPLVLGGLTLEFGKNVGIAGKTTLAGRAVSGPKPVLRVGDNAEIGWQTQISVGRRVEIGNNVLIAANCFLAGYPGHPLDPAARAAHEPDTDGQVGDIVLEDGVWLGHGVIVMAGVRIGAGTVVTPGSVVFRDLPAGVIATGNPARPAGFVSIAVENEKPPSPNPLPKWRGLSGVSSPQLGDGVSGVSFPQARRGSPQRIERASSLPLGERDRVRGDSESDQPGLLIPTASADFNETGGNNGGHKYG